MKTDIRTVRVCNVCGKPMLHGYTMYDTEYACSDECLLKSYGGDRKAMEADFADHGEEGDSECFWTCWPSMFFAEDELTIEDLKYMWVQLNDISAHIDNYGNTVITEGFAVPSCSPSSPSGVGCCSSKLSSTTISIIPL